MAVSRENLTAWLRDAYAMENQAIEILEKQASRLEHYPELRAKVSPSSCSYISAASAQLNQPTGL
jgi:ferritin-like metal-binding protein YciE